jgi:hypothetical protein
VAQSPSNDRTRSDPLPEKPVPPPTQSVIKGGWTYRIEDPVERSVSALKDLARDVRERSKFFVVDGPKLLPPVQARAREQEIVSLAKEIDTLAARQQRQTNVTYEDVEAILLRLRKLGSFPDGLLVNNVARALHVVEQMRTKPDIGVEPP